MKIIFNLLNCGLGNNGGSHTIVRSANTLAKLGNEVTIIDNTKIGYNWTPIKCDYLSIKRENQIPDADFIIATGYKTVKSTLNIPQRCGKKIHWIRGWETWKMDENVIIKNILNVPTIKVVNSIGLQNYIEKFNIRSFVIRPGYDFNEQYPMNLRKNNNEIVLGGLYHTKHKTKRSDWILKIQSEFKDKYKTKLYMYGTDKMTDSVIDRYVKTPSIEEKNEIYNSINVWLAPTCLEGLHIPPAEAMLTECCVVGINAELSGTKDYLIHNHSGVVSENNFESFRRSVEKIIINSKKRFELGKKGREEIISLGSREYNMKKFVKLLEELK